MTTRTEGRVIPITAKNPTRAGRPPVRPHTGGKPPGCTPRAAAEALRDYKGLITDAAKALGIAPRTLRAYIYKHPQVSEAYKEARQQMGDLCESRLFDAIARGESWAIKFYATTQMRDRGYGDKPTPMDTGGATKVEQPKSLSIDYDAYNRAYEEAMHVIRDGESTGSD